MLFDPGEIPRIKGFDQYFQKCDELVQTINDYPESDRLKRRIGEYVNVLETYSAHLFKNKYWDAVEQIWQVLLNIDVFSGFVLGDLVAIYKERAEVDKMEILLEDIRLNVYPKIKAEIFDFVNDSELKSVIEPIHRMMLDGDYQDALNEIMKKMPQFPDQNRVLFFRLTMKQINILLLSGNEAEAWKVLTNLKVAYIGYRDYAKMAEINMRQTELLKKMGKYPDAVISLIGYYVYSDLHQQKRISSAVQFTDWIEQSELIELLKKARLDSITDQVVDLIHAEYEHFNERSIRLIDHIKKLFRETIKGKSGGDYDRSH